MKANDLMIDDWVYNKNIDKPMQIYPTIFSQMFRSNPNATTEDYNIFPIPLTPEILEKNGFVFLSGLWYLITKERKPIHIVFKDNNVITLSINATPVPIGLKYIHQLQHALRLYGIEKEIIL